MEIVQISIQGRKPGYKMPHSGQEPQRAGRHINLPSDWSKARLSGNVVALEKGDKLFVEMINGTSSLGYVDNVFKGNFAATDGVYDGFTPGNNTFVSIKTEADGRDKKSKATLTVDGVTATILGIEVRHTDSTTQPLLNANNLYVYLNKNLKNLGMTLSDGTDEL